MDALWHAYCCLSSITAHFPVTSSVRNSCNHIGSKSTGWEENALMKVHYAAYYVSLLGMYTYNWEKCVPLDIPKKHLEHVPMQTCLLISMLSHCHISQTCPTTCMILWLHYAYTHTVPLEAPEDFQATAGERRVTFFWTPPSTATPSVHGYTLSCSPSPATLPQSFPQSGSYTVGGFSPDTVYNCSVAAYTSQIIGPPATSTAFTTTEDNCKSPAHTYIIVIEFCTWCPYYQQNLPFQIINFKVQPLWEEL